MAGTIVVSAVRESDRAVSKVHAVTFLCTADAADGSFPTIDLADFGVWGTLLWLQTNPGAVAPTDNYDITAVDQDGIDRFDSVGLNRDTSSSERAIITGSPWVARGETLTLTIANNSVNSAVISVTVGYTHDVSFAPGFAQALSAAVDSIALGAAATGGGTPWRSLDLDESEEEVKATAGTLLFLNWTNRTTALRYLKLYNATAANVTVGTTTPIWTIPLPANASDHVAAGFGLGPYGLAFDTALCMAVTTGLADNDTGAPGANDVVVNALYK